MTAPNTTENPLFMNESGVEHSDTQSSLSLQCSVMPLKTKDEVDFVAQFLANYESQPHSPFKQEVVIFENTLISDEKSIQEDETLNKSNWLNRLEQKIDEIDEKIRRQS